MNEKLVFPRTEFGLKKQMDDCIEVMSLSVVLTDLVKIKSFYTVIAAQLRLLLCDTSKRNNEIIDNSLILKVIDNPKLPPITNDYYIDTAGNTTGKFINPNNIFDEKAEPIELNSWLNQALYYIDNNKPVTIFDIIKNYSNKQGGSHVDSKITGRELFSIAMAEHFLNDIAKCVVKHLGYNLMGIAGENIRKLNEKLYELSESIN